MSLLNRNDLLHNGYFLDGEPFVSIEAKSGIDTLHNGYFLDGEPFVVLATDSYPNSTANSNFIVFFM